MKKNCTYIAVLSTMEYFILCIPCLLSNALKSRYFVKLPSAFILFYFILWPAVLLNEKLFCFVAGQCVVRQCS